MAPMSGTLRDIPGHCPAVSRDGTGQGSKTCPALSRFEG
jgi:hypothetical protein